MIDDFKTELPRAKDAKGRHGKTSTFVSFAPFARGRLGKS
jgi:hypothetical protein